MNAGKATDVALIHLIDGNKAIANTLENTSQNEVIQIVSVTTIFNSGLKSGQKLKEKIQVLCNNNEKVEKQNSVLATATLVRQNNNTLKQCLEDQALEINRAVGAAGGWGIRVVARL